MQQVGSSYPTNEASSSKRNFLENSILRGFVKIKSVFDFAANLFAKDQRFTVMIKKIVQSSWFLVHEAKKKRGSLYPTFPYFVVFPHHIPPIMTFGPAPPSSG